MGRLKPSLNYLIVASLIPACCGSSDIPASTMDRIMQAHVQILTVDARVDLAGEGRSGFGALAPEHMKKGGLDAAVFYLPVPRTRPAQQSRATAMEAALECLARLDEALEERSGLIGRGLTSDDAYRLEKEGRRAAFIGLASGDAIGTDLSLLGVFHARGVRVLALCGGVDNAICDSALDLDHPGDRGLSEFGKRVVAECNRLGLLIDVASCSDRSILEVLAASRAPVVCSRAAARALSDRPGNLADAAIEAIAAGGGVINVSFEPTALVPPAASRRASVADVADHIEHMMRKGGVGGVGVGSRFGAGGGVSGCRDAGGMPTLTVELLRRGHGERTIEAVWGRNIMRVLKQAAVLAGAGEEVRR